MEIRAYEITAERHLKPLNPELIDDSWDADKVCRWIDVSNIISEEIENLLDRLTSTFPPGSERPFAMPRNDHW